MTTIDDLSTLLLPRLPAITDTAWQGTPTHGPTCNADFPTTPASGAP
ncbi:hypothetical protein [Streptomyces sp. CA-132043]